MKIVIVVVALVCAAKGLSIPEYSNKIQDGCRIDFDEALLVTAWSWGNGSLLPQPASADRFPKEALDLEAGEQIRVACQRQDGVIRVLGKPEAVVRCTGDGKFREVDGTGEDFDFEDFNCADNLVPAIDYPTCINDKGILLKIGFQVGTDFVKMIDVCFDNVKKITKWTRHVLVAGIRDKQQLVDDYRPLFKNDGFYPSHYTSYYDPNYQYSPKAEFKTFNRILGEREAVKYIDKVTPESPKVLARGHLSPRADFVYRSQQDATFHLINAAPQWQSFNEGNWEKIERDLRELANSMQNDLIVYTGTYKILELPNNSQGTGEIWLRYYVTKTASDKAISVPKLFWKVVYDELNKLAVAIFTFNYPYIKGKGISDSAYKLCAGNEITNQIGWLRSWRPTDYSQGYSYCCEVTPDFVKEYIPSLPDLIVNGILV